MDLLKSALRSLRAHPTFTALIVLLLTLGIGANTAIFGVVDAVLLKPLPYPQAGDLVVARKLPREGGTASIPGGGDQMPDSEFLAWLEAAPSSFRALAAYRNSAVTLQRGDGAVRVPSAIVTGGFFPMLGVSAWRGRLFDATDVKVGAPPVTVISYATWQSKFAGDDSVLGQIVKLDDVAHTVIGVLPPSFEFVDPVQFWRPLAMSPAAPGQLRITMIRVFGRVQPGTHFAVAQEELDAISGRFWDNLTSGLMRGPMGGGDGRRMMMGPGPADGNQRVMRSPDASTGPTGTSQQVVREPGAGPTLNGAPQRVAAGGLPAVASAKAGPRISLPFANTSTQLVPLQEQLAKQSRTTLWLLLGAVAFVLLIACANIANLQLARAASRRREIAIRAALGASPRRLAAGLLVENLLLALAGGVLGVLLAWWGTQALQVWLADYLPRINPVGVSLPVLGFAVVLALVAGLGFGLAPAWQGSRIDLLDTLKDGGHQSSPSGHRWRQGLVALEVALALVLTVNTGLLVKSIYRLYSAELGFRTADVLTANLSLPRRYSTPVQQRDFADRWLAALSGLPGVKQVALTDSPPLSPYTQMVLAVTQGSSQANASQGSAPPTMSIASVTPDYFRAAGIALRQGRFFGEQDGADANAVAVVNEEFVRTFYPNGFTLGAQVNVPTMGVMHGLPPTAAIVGVVANTRPRGFDSVPLPLAYFPLAQQPRTRLTAVLQFAGDSSALARAVTLATSKVDANLAVDTPLTLEQQLARQTAPRRVTLMLTGAFAATAVLLAALGIFGVMSYTVTQRTQEIGVRMALGANSKMILHWIMHYGGVAIGAGLLVGLALVFATGKLLASLLHDVTSSDPLILTLGVLLLALTGFAACLLPAVRATRVNPVDALRSE